MATAKRSRSDRPRLVPRLLLAVAILLGAIGFIYREPIQGYTATGTAFGARTACACRHVAGRALDDCRKDFEPGMELVFLSEDEADRSVTASVPLLARQTATWREGYGCVLEPWDG